MPSESAFAFEINQSPEEGSEQWLALAQRAFVLSSATVLLLTAAAKLFSVTGDARILAAPDAVFLMPNRWLMALAALLEAGLAAYLFCGTRLTRKLMAIGALSVNFALYRFGNWLLGAVTCPCLGSLTDKLNIPAATADFTLKLVLGYFFVGSLLLLCARRLSSLSLGQDAETQGLVTSRNA